MIESGVSAEGDEKTCLARAEYKFAAMKRLVRKGKTFVLRCDLRCSFHTQTNATCMVCIPSDAFWRKQSTTLSMRNTLPAEFGGICR
jgi:hypothetical protein